MRALPACPTAMCPARLRRLYSRRASHRVTQTAERKKTSAQLVGLLGMRASEARRKMTELAHEKVSNALEQQAEMEEQKAAQLAPLTRDRSGAQEFMSLQDLVAEQRAYKRVGFTQEVFELQSLINDKKGDAEGDKVTEDEKLIKQRTAAMEIRQRRRSIELQKAQQSETEIIITSQMTEYQTLLEKQADEMHQLVENVTAMMTIGQGWTPAPRANESVNDIVSWAIQLKKHRFRPSRELAALMSNVTKLGELHSQASMLKQLQDQSDALEKREREIWRKSTMRAVLGNDRGSLASQLVAGHKVAQEKLKDHHRQKLRALDKTHGAAVTTLEGQFRCARCRTSRLAEAGWPHHCPLSRACILRPSAQTHPLSTTGWRS